nr:PE-PGRS family protein PE_PGRS61-like [Aegilops tauschii subsp. strangulata]
MATVVAFHLISGDGGGGRSGSTSVRRLAGAKEGNEVVVAPMGDLTDEGGGGLTAAVGVDVAGEDGDGGSDVEGIGCSGVGGDGRVDGEVPRDGGNLMAVAASVVGGGEVRDKAAELANSGEFARGVGRVSGAAV